MDLPRWCAVSAFATAWTAQFLANAAADVQHALSWSERQAEEARLMQALERLRKPLSHLPFAELPLLRREALAYYYYDWLAHPDGDEYWQRWSTLAHHAQIRVSAFNLGGWYDLFFAGPPRNFASLRERAATEAARKGQRLLMGPWTHNSPSIAIAGDMNFGWAATLSADDLQLRWFDYWLRRLTTASWTSLPCVST